MIKQKYRLEFAVDPEFMQKLEKIKSLLSTKHPKGIGFEALFNILMDEYLERNAPESRAIRREQRKKRSSDKKKNVGKERKNGTDPASKKRSITDEKTGKTRKRQPRLDPNAQTRHIPKAFKDQVYARDKGRCTYVGKNGKRCNSRWNLQIDHKVPYARGGTNTLDNLRLLCAKHNRLEAEREYGIEFMKQYVQKE